MMANDSFKYYNSKKEYGGSEGMAPEHLTQNLQILLKNKANPGCT